MFELYGIRCRVGGVIFEEAILASSWEQAEVIAEQRGGEVTGKMFDDGCYHEEPDYNYEEWN